MSRKQEPPAVIPAWLAGLAARDDPPSEIQPQTIARFKAAGVERLVPTEGTTSLDEADAVRATSIGAVGPGFGFGESFEGEPAQVAAALARLLRHIEAFDRLRRLRLAAQDMRRVAETARALRNREGPARVYERMLEVPETVYGAGIGSHYQAQGLKLSKHFR